jgi:hypothetical protein
MSNTTKEILGRVRQLVPPMLDKFHKGESTSNNVLSGHSRDTVNADGSGACDETRG